MEAQIGVWDANYRLVAWRDPAIQLCLSIRTEGDSSAAWMQCVWVCVCICASESRILIIIPHKHQQFLSGERNLACVSVLCERVCVCVHKLAHESLIK